MANLRMAAWRLLDKYDVDVPEDFLREMLELLVNLLMEAEISELIGAERYERSESRTDHRNGVRQRRWDTRVGTLDLEVPRLRETEYFPSFLDRRRRSEQAMLAVVQEAYVNGVSARKVDRLVQSLGIEGMSKSQVSAICTELDEVVEAWRNRPLEEPIVEEHRIHSLKCPTCGTVTKADVPAELRESPFGPRLHSLVALLGGMFR